ncbi:MAG: zf-TFIIB domain-containing protein [Cryobacterium sp.]|nr:zf-TFIIB domain-containing protein [Oligoflexia bacterium]
MKCPNCGTNLLPFPEQVGMEACPACGGTFLKAGVLQKMLQSEKLEGQKENHPINLI